MARRLPTDRNQPVHAFAAGRTTPPARHELEVDRRTRIADHARAAARAARTIEVRQLFYNTPVRRKFQRSTQTEMGHVGEAFTRVGARLSQVHCTLSTTAASVYDLPPAADWRERIAAFFGHELAADVIPIGPARTTTCS